MIDDRIPQPAMLRLFDIIKSQLRELPFDVFIETVRQSLFRNDPILVYSLRLNEAAGIEVEWRKVPQIRQGDLVELEQIAGKFRPLPWEFLCHRYDGVKDFFVAQSAGEIQHISWIYYRQDPNRLLRLGALDAEIKYCLTLEAFRGRGLYPKVLATIARFLSERGFKRVFICVHKNNFPSIRGIEKAGFKYVGRIRLVKIMGFQVSRKFVIPNV